MKKISFDFDGTLSFIDDKIECMKHIQDFCKSLTYAKQHDIFIITRRYGPSSGYTEHKEVYTLAEKLKINPKNIIFTNRKYKYETIKVLNIDIHIDDDIQDIEFIIKHTTCKTVDSLDRAWKEKFETLINADSPIS